MEKEKLQQDLSTIVNDVLAEANLKAGDVFVLGCTTSEIVGGTIGKNSSQEVGQWVIETLKSILDPKRSIWAFKAVNTLIVLLLSSERLPKKGLGDRIR